MNERLLNRVERRLWYDGPNYTADAVILDPEATRVLLIQRQDTGDWALPGGFIDSTDASSLDAAIREVKEEVNLTLIDDAPLIFRGKVEDPRNSAEAWIETSAHLFTSSPDTVVMSGDDAKEAHWYHLSDLPPLYGSHSMLIRRALDYRYSQQLFTYEQAAELRTPVSGGYMQYDKYVATHGGQQVFVKQMPDIAIISGERAAAMQQYLEKEAGVMAHLRVHNFTHVPETSAFYGSALMMNALREEDGWHWQIDNDRTDTYIHDALDTFKQLECAPLMPDTFAVESSYESLIREGWQLYHGDTDAEKLEHLIAQLPPEYAARSQEFLADIPVLQQLAGTLSAPDTFVMCHHDMRQENFAWHPDKGIQIIDWSWAGPGRPGSDATSFLIDLYKNGYDVSGYSSYVNREHCLTLIGFWLAHSTLPNQGADGLREQQFISALSGYELLLQTQRQPH